MMSVGCSPPRDGRSRNAAQIATKVHHCEARLPRDQLGDCVRLTEPQLENQDATGSQPLRCLVDQPPDDRQPVTTREEGDRRFVIAHLRRERGAVGLGDVRRIRNNEVECVVDRVQHIGPHELDARVHTVARGVAASDANRTIGQIGGDQTRRRALVSDRDGQAAAARADVGGRKGLARRKELERDFDDDLAFRPWNEHGRRHGEGEPPEFLTAGDVGDRLAPEASRDQRLERRREARRMGLISGREKPRCVPAQQVLGEQSSVELGFVGRNAGVAQPLARRCDTRVNGVRRRPWRL